jgi:hypothetical protein
MKSAATVKHDDSAVESTAVPASAMNRGSALSDLTGGDLGIGGGFLIAAAPDKVKTRQHQEALAAAEKAEQAPCVLEMVHDAPGADLNGDGFITLDEILAMVRSGLSDREVIDRLQRTKYIFHLTPQQERYLTDRGVSQNVVGALHQLSDRRMASGPL